jgi:predicted Zn-dependent protease
MLRADDDHGGQRVTDGMRREGEPAGEVYDWFVRANELLEGGNPEAAAELLSHARRREPESASVLETLARALFDARRYPEAERRFTELVETSPDSDYARFGLGLSRMRLGDHGGAIEQLSMAAAMRPGRKDYQQALREARATVRARAEAAEQPFGDGPSDERRPSEPGA